MTFQVTHRIAGDIDAERDHIVATLTEANPTASVAVIRNFSTGYHDRNGGGDAIDTDGDLPVVDLRATGGAVVKAASGPTDSRDKRPAPTTFGAMVAGLRGLVALTVAVILLIAPEADNVLPSNAQADSAATTALAFILVGLVDIALGLAVFFGSNVARLVLMLDSAVAIVIAFVATLGGGPEPTIGAGLPAIALSILALLALTSHRARDYATRDRAAPVRVAGRPRPGDPFVRGSSGPSSLS
jgi:hypothetical protein